MSDVSITPVFYFVVLSFEEVKSYLLSNTGVAPSYR